MDRPPPLEGDTETLDDWEAEQASSLGSESDTDLVHNSDSFSPPLDMGENILGVNFPKDLNFNAENIQVNYEKFKKVVQSMFRGPYEEKKRTTKI